MRHHRRQALIAGATLFFYIVAQGSLLFADYPLAESIATSEALGRLRTVDLRVDLPERLGTIESIREGTGPLLFHIQEAHGQREGEKKIRDILAYLHEHYGVKEVFLEGDAGELRPENLPVFLEKPKWTEQTLQRLFDWGRVTGPVFFLATTPGSHGQGIESPAVYQKNKQAFQVVLKARKKSGRFLKSLNSQILRFSSPYLNAQLRRFLKEERLFENGQLPLEDWLEILRGRAYEHLAIDLNSPRFQADWPTLTRFFALTHFEAERDLTAYNGERQSFLIAVSRFIPKTQGRESLYAQLEFLLEGALNPRFVPGAATVSVVELLLGALPENFDDTAWPNVTQALKGLVLQSEWDGASLSQELRQLTVRLEDVLAGETKAREVLRLLREYRLLQKLFKLELSPEDYESLRKLHRRPSVCIRDFTILNKDRRVREVAFDNLADVDVLYKQAMAFYRLARKRDRLMIRNVERAVVERKQEKVVVITGGFHAQPFEEYFSRKGWRYARLTPKLKTIAGRSSYIQRMFEGMQSPVPRKSTLRVADQVVLGLKDLRDLGFSPWFSRASMVAAAVQTVLESKGPKRAEVLSSLTVLNRELQSTGVAMDFDFDQDGAVRVRFHSSKDGPTEVRVNSDGAVSRLPESSRALARSEMRTGVYGENQMNRRFQELDDMHDHRISRAIRARLDAGSKPKILLIGIGQGTSAYDLLQQYDSAFQDKIELHSLNLQPPDMILHTAEGLAAQIGESLNVADAGRFLTKIRERYYTIDLDEATQFPITDQKFDMVIMGTAVMEYIQQRARLLENLKRSLVQGGEYFTDLDIAFKVYGLNGEPMDTLDFFRQLSLGEYAADYAVLSGEKKTGMYPVLHVTNRHPERTTVPLTKATSFKYNVISPGAEGDPNTSFFDTPRASEQRSEVRLKPSLEQAERLALWSGFVPLHVRTELGARRFRAMTQRVNADSERPAVEVQIEGLIRRLGAKAVTSQAFGNIFRSMLRVLTAYESAGAANQAERAHEEEVPREAPVRVPGTVPLPAPAPRPATPAPRPAPAWPAPVRPRQPVPAGAEVRSALKSMPLSTIHLRPSLSRSEARSPRAEFPTPLKELIQREIQSPIFEKLFDWFLHIQHYLHRKPALSDADLQKRFEKGLDMKFAMGLIVFGVLFQGVLGKALIPVILVILGAPILIMTLLHVRIANLWTVQNQTKKILKLLSDYARTAPESFTPDRLREMKSLMGRFSPPGAREFVLASLPIIARANPGLVEDMEPILVAGLTSWIGSVRREALSVLDNLLEAHPQLLATEKIFHEVLAPRSTSAWPLVFDQSIRKFGYKDSRDIWRSVVEQMIQHHPEVLSRKNYKQLQRALKSRSPYVRDQAIWALQFFGNLPEFKAETLQSLGIFAASQPTSSAWAEARRWGRLSYSSEGLFNQMLRHDPQGAKVWIDNFVDSSVKPASLLSFLDSHPDYIPGVVERLHVILSRSDDPDLVRGKLQILPELLTKYPAWAPLLLEPVVLLVANSRQRWGNETNIFASPVRETAYEIVRKMLELKTVDIPQIRDVMTRTFFRADKEATAGELRALLVFQRDYPELIPAVLPQARAAIEHLNDPGLNALAVSLFSTLAAQDGELKKALAPLMKKILPQSGFRAALAVSATRKTPLDQFLTLGAKLKMGGGRHKRLAPASASVSELAEWIMKQRWNAGTEDIQISVGYNTDNLPSEKDRSKFIGLWLFISTTYLQSFQALKPSPVRDPNAAYGLLINGDVVDPKAPGQVEGYRRDHLFTLSEHLNESNLAALLRQIQLLNLGLLIANAENLHRFWLGADGFELTPQMVGLAGRYRRFERDLVRLLRRYDSYRNSSQIYDGAGQIFHHEERVAAAVRYRQEEFLYPGNSRIPDLYQVDTTWLTQLDFLRAVEAMMLNQMATDRVVETPQGRQVLSAGQALIHDARLLGFEAASDMEKILAGKVQQAFEGAQPVLEGDPFLDPLATDYSQRYLSSLAERLRSGMLATSEISNWEKVQAAMTFYAIQFAPSARSELRKIMSDGKSWQSEPKAHEEEVPREAPVRVPGTVPLPAPRPATPAPSPAPAWPAPVRPRQPVPAGAEVGSAMKSLPPSTVDLRPSLKQAVKQITREAAATGRLPADALVEALWQPGSILEKSLRQALRGRHQFQLPTLMGRMRRSVMESASPAGLLNARSAESDAVAQRQIDAFDFAVSQQLAANLQSLSGIPPSENLNLAISFTSEPSVKVRGALEEIAQQVQQLYVLSPKPIRFRGNRQARVVALKDSWQAVEQLRLTSERVGNVFGVIATDAVAQKILSTLVTAYVPLETIPQRLQMSALKATGAVVLTLVRTQRPDEIKKILEEPARLRAFLHQFFPFLETSFALQQGAATFDLSGMLKAVQSFATAA